MLAVSDRTVVVEGNRYFPPATIKREYLSPSDTQTTCPWKGTAGYYHVGVGDKARSVLKHWPAVKKAEAHPEEVLAFFKAR